MEIATLPENLSKNKSSVSGEKRFKSLRKNDVSGVLFQGGFRSNDEAAFFEKLVTKRDLASFLCVSEGLVNKLVAERGMPHIKLGRNIRFSVKDVMSWLEQKGFKQ